MNVPRTRRNLVGGCLITGLGCLYLGLALGHDPIDTVNVVSGAVLGICGAVQFWTGFRSLPRNSANGGSSQETASVRDPAI